MQTRPFLDEHASDGAAPSLTKQAMVYRRLRSAILHCELDPGQRLIIEDIAKRFRVSLIPVREALSLLQAEGLVVTIPHAGATVSPLTRESITEVFTVLEGLETVATQVAAGHLRPEQAAQLEQLLAAMDEACANGDHGAWADDNTAWHRAIARLTGMPLLLSMTEQALDRWDRIRRYFFRDVFTPRIEQAQQEHHAILQAMREDDKARIAHLLEQHNRQALASYLAYLDRKTSDPTHEEKRTKKSKPERGNQHR